MAGTNDAHYAITNMYEGFEEVGTIDDDISDYKNTSHKTFCKSQAGSNNKAFYI